jgi:hypothetical protein
VADLLHDVTFHSALALGKAAAASTRLTEFEVALDCIMLNSNSISIKQLEGTEPQAEFVEVGHQGHLHPNYLLAMPALTPPRFCKLNFFPAVSS